MKGQEFLKRTTIVNNIETELRKIEQTLENLQKQSNDLLVNDASFDLWTRIINAKKEIFEGRIIAYKQRDKLRGKQEHLETIINN
tara:strand:- start:384 stop:638 length:255 start_codon:yes stop_codon:yes gene_type:complete